jgi:hypothetical protein
MTPLTINLDPRTRRIAIDLLRAEWWDALLDRRRDPDLSDPLPGRPEGVQELPYILFDLLGIEMQVTSQTAREKTLDDVRECFIERIFQLSSRSMMPSEDDFDKMVSEALQEANEELSRALEVNGKMW